MEALDLLRANLLSPVVLAFFLGAIAVWVKSDLQFPKEVYAALSIYLLLAIGFKGGQRLAETPLAMIAVPMMVTVALGVLTPAIAYAASRWAGRLSVVDSAALAAHYGSVSAVTFAASLSFLDTKQVPYEGFMPALVAVLEVPAIVIAVVIARVAGRAEGDAPTSWGTVLHEVLSGRSIVLLVGGLLIGYVSDPRAIERVSPFFVDLFHGVLVLFLLDMGIVAAERLREVGRGAWFLAGLGTAVPVVNGLLGALAGHAAGLSMGGTTVLGVMTASASYIAAPAAVRVALPRANPAYYLTAAIGITFPFNLTIGIPLVYEFSRWLHRTP